MVPKYVFLDSTSYEYVVDEETYKQIASLVKAGKRCNSTYRDHHPYTLENPCVGKGICLQHTLLKHPNLSYMNPFGEDTDGNAIYRFVDTKGYVYTSTENISNEPHEDMRETLGHYGFEPPETIESKGRVVDFRTYYARLHGDLRTASVIVLSYNQDTEKVKGLFLLYKHGPTKELSKKSDVYRHANELVESTKMPDGSYLINGNRQYAKWESDVLDVVSQLESAVYDVTLKFNHKEGQYA
ncbi:MAG: hypothetical protein JO202_04595 [Ktedonobacteraceae bacterium]|nr:hypothetical protein [Ktedonobacteraceae bacterium]